MKEIMKLGAILFAVCLIAAVALMATYEMTSPIIATQRAQKDENARREVLPAANSFNKVSEDYDTSVTLDDGNVVAISEVYSGEKDGQVVGYVIKSTPGGYGGAVEVVTGIDGAGLITGVRVGSHQETPGLGAKATLPDFYSQYDGKVASTISVNKTQQSDTEVQAIAGATITSKAVTSGVNASAVVAASLSE